MKFMNNTKSVKRFRDKGLWHDVKPGEAIDLPVEANLNEEGLEKVVELAKLAEKPIDRKSVV